MCTYLKNMEGYKLNDLKLKDFDSIQEMFDRAFKRVSTFEDFRTKLVEGKEKRAGTELAHKITKKQKVEDDKETKKIKKLMEIIPDEEEVTIDAIPLAVKSPTGVSTASEDLLKEFDLLKWDQHIRLGNDAHADDADIRPIYDEEPMAEVQMTAEINVFTTGQQHTEQPKFNNKGEVDVNAKQCHDTCPLPAKLSNNQITELSNQSLESENIYLKKTVAQFQKDFSKLKAHCLNLELQLQNNVLKSGQQSQFLKEKSNEAKVKHGIDVIETINIELEHKVAKLLKENETLKRHYKELSDSIKTTRAKTIEHTTSLITQNAEFKAQL
ncbi:hypothetical protein Tco_0329097 [Tanacetum coccineum]